MFNSRIQVATYAQFDSEKIYIYQTYKEKALGDQEQILGLLGKFLLASV